MKNNKVIWAFLAVLGLSGLVIAAGETHFRDSIFNGAVSVGTTSAAGSKAILDLVSTTKGLLPPRQTTTQRDAISSPTEGLVIYNSTTHFLDYYNGSAWLEGASLTGTETLTNKSMSGSSNTFTNINGSSLVNTSVDLTTKVTGILPNANTTAASANTASAIVTRDASGNFAAGVITATLTGNASTATLAAGATALAADPADCSANTYATTIAASGALTCASITNASTTAVSTNTNSTIVLRDGSGNFAAGTITATLAGNASTANLATSATLAVAATAPAAGSANGVVILSAGGAFASVAPGTSGNALVSNGTTWSSSTVAASAPTSSSDIKNLGIASSVGSSALTIAIKQADGATDPAAGAAAVLIGMRSSTLTSGLYNQRTLAAASSIVVPSTATMGQTSTKPWAMYIYLIDNAGTLEPALAGSLFHENQVVTTTTIDTASDSASVMYSTTGRSAVPFRLVGKLTNTQTTAGTWASAGTLLQVGDFAALIKFATPTVQRFLSASSNYYVPAGVTYIVVDCLGGGAGGVGDSAGGSNGGATTFDDWTCSGGSGSAGQPGGVGGAVTAGTGTVLVSMVGNRGSPGMNLPGTGGGNGGAGVFGGAGSGGQDNTSGTAATANSGAGGGGTGSPPAAGSGAGGGAGGYQKFIPTFKSAYAYGVGALGGGGATTKVGGNGGSGIIIVTEYYN